MMNWFKTLTKRPIVIDFYTDRADVYKFSRPMKAIKALPQWWKNLPTTATLNPMQPRASMKRCNGFIDLYSNGFVMPMWSDLNVNIGSIGNSSYRWQYADSLSNLEPHPPQQRGEYLPDKNYQHLKLICPWVGVCKEDISWMMVGAVWNFDKPETIIIPPAVLDFKYQTSLNVNMFFTRGEQEQMVSFEHGQPLVHVVQMSNRPIVCKYHLVSPQELQAHTTPSLRFNKNYKSIKAASNGKCPF